MVKFTLLPVLVLGVAGLVAFFLLTQDPKVAGKSRISQIFTALGGIFNIDLTKTSVEQQTKEQEPSEA